MAAPGWPQRIVFMGTPDFARTSLAALIGAGPKPVLVVTQPDRPAGRGHALKSSPVKALALEEDIEVFQPATLKDPASQERLREARPDLVVVAAFGQILPRAVLDIPELGCVNVHASLLPRHRGASPIARAIWEGDDRTGVCIMRMDTGLDTGPVFLREAIPVPPDATAGSLEPILASLGAELLLRALPEIASGRWVPEPQDESLATLAPRIRREQGSLHFQQVAVRLERQVRALQPWPGAFVRLGGEEIKIRRASVGGAALPGERPGTVRSEGGLEVVCGDGRLLHLVEVQRPGKRPVSSAEFLRGFKVPPGTTLEVSS